MTKNKYLVVIPGIILAFVLYTLSQGFNNIIGIELLGYEKSPISFKICLNFITFVHSIFRSLRRNEMGDYLNLRKE